MIQIAVAFEQSEEIDAIDPLGDITITDGQTKIREKSTYLDSWFDALITGIQSVQQGKKATIEIVEEPETLRFEPWQSGMRVSYHNQAIAVDNIDEFSSALKLAAKDFLLKLDHLTGNERNDLLKVIRDFVNKPT